MKDELTRTTLRLPAAVHRELRVAAAAEGTTSEAILLEALKRELARRAARHREVSIPDEMNPLMAELFAQSLPAFILIKDKRGRIRWVNAYFERTHGKSLSSVMGSTLTEAGLLRGIRKETIEANIDLALHSTTPVMSIEGLTLEGVGDAVVRAYRFRFAKDSFLGDISFLERDLEERRFDVYRDAIELMQRSHIALGVEDLLVPFLEEVPACMAIKRPSDGSSVILWANAEYRKLAKREQLNEIINRTTQEVFDLPPGHDVLSNEAEVVTTGRACVTKERLPDRQPRWSLRFPIFDRAGLVQLIGVVSPEFSPNSATSALSDVSSEL